MKALFVALAMLFASPVGAVTYDATLSGPIQNGSIYWFTYSIGDIPFDPTVYNAWNLKLNVNGLQMGDIPGVTQGEYSPANGTFWFNYAYNPKAPSALTVNGVLEAYIGASVKDESTTGRQNWVVKPVDGTQTVSFVFNPVAFKPFEPTPATVEQKQQLLAIAQPTAVPIGGTLPLMLTALAVGGFVLRNRAKVA